MIARGLGSVEIMHCYFLFRKTVNAVKEVCVRSQMPTQAVISEVVCSTPQAVVGLLPCLSLMKRTVQRRRASASTLPPVPNSLRGLRIEGTFATTEAGQPFLLHDNMVDGHRVLIFSTQRNLQLLSECEHWYCDGTFKTVPLLFEQLYTVHGVQHSAVIPSAYILMEKRDTASYQMAFSALNSLQPTLRPTSVMTDFERSARNSLQEAFPNTTLRGCFFHFSQCIWRCIQRTGLQERYARDPCFALHIRYLGALAYVPLVDVASSFEAVLESDFYVQNEPDLVELINYFEDTWIGRTDRRGRRREPLFPHSSWNCYESAVSDIPRTNNSVEGWHSGFANLVGCSHPNIWKFIKCLKKEQCLSEVRVEQHLSGAQPTPSKKVYRDTALRVRRIAEDYENRDIMDYLRGIAYNFQLQV